MSPEDDVSERSNQCKGREETMRTRHKLAAILAIVGFGASGVAVTIACYKDDTAIPCINAPTETIKCPVITSQGTTNNVDTTVTFHITVPCTVAGSRLANPGESGFVNQQKSTAQSCNAQGWWPDCSGNSTGVILQKVTCQESLTDRTSEPCIVKL
jgi:hypothetical protein